MRTENLLLIFPPRRRMAAAGLLVSLAGLLGGCMAMGERPPAVTPPPAGASAEASPEHRHTSLASANSNKFVAEKHPAKIDTVEMRASVDPKSLLGLDSDGVLKRLGAPAHIKTGPLSREWTYASSGCSFQVFFYPDMNSTSFKVLKYSSHDGSGETMDSSNVCVRRLLTARSNNADN